MQKERSKTAWGLLFLLCLSSNAAAQVIPSDFTPFVRLGHLVKLSIFKNPVLDAEKGSVLNRGELMREEVVQMPVGSGTIISADGMILTNWHVYQIRDQYQFDQANNLLRVAEPAGNAMLVYWLKDNDPLKIPVFQYLAIPLSLDEKHDTALLKIVADKDGNRINKVDFSHVRLGNPFGMKINENITVLGYPGKGGDTITMTDGKFLGYYRDERFPGLDGFIKTNAAMAPGNSGGAALNKQALVGVPTAVTLPTEAGSDLGYIHPVTWALKGFVIAKHKFGLSPPEIPLGWLMSPYNTDGTAQNVFVIGSVLSASSQKGLRGRILIIRSDRTLEGIEELHRNVQAVSIIFSMQQMQRFGLSVDEIAKRFNVTSAEAKRILAAELSEDDISEDIPRYLAGEFFYEVGESDEEGFFILSVPKREKVSLHVFKEGFRPVSKDFITVEGSFQNLGRIKVYSY